ncbi:MAG: DUF378 domain-containing protein [Nanoarchaeota archaeon]
MAKTNAVDWVAMVLVIIGGVNWGLYGLFQLDLVETIFEPIFGEFSVVARVVYTLVGVSAVYMIYMGLTKLE